MKTRLNVLCFVLLGSQILSGALSANESAKTATMGMPVFVQNCCAAASSNKASRHRLRVSYAFLRHHPDARDGVKGVLCGS